MSSKVLEYDGDDPAWLHEPNYLDYDEIVDEDEYDDGEVEEGKYFFTDGDNWLWLEPIGDEYYLDFDKWQVWKATNGKTEEFFVVEVDTGFIDWGPCSEREAREFLESKYQDYLSEELKSDYSDEDIDDIIEVDESYDGSYGDGSISYPVHMASAEVGMSASDFDVIGIIHADSEDEANKLLVKYFPSTIGTKYYLGYPEELTDDIVEVDELSEDTVKKANGKWTNRGDDGTEHGEFSTKKAADAQRRAMFTNGYKAESDECTDEELDEIVEDTGIGRNHMLITVKSGIGGDGFRIIITNDRGDKEFDHEYAYGYDASYKRDWSSKKTPYVSDIINGLSHEYNIDRRDIQVVPGKNVMKDADVSDKIVKSFKDKYLESKYTSGKRFYVDVNDSDGNYYDSMYVYCDRKSQCQKEINKMLGSKYKVAHVWEEEDEATNPGSIPSIPGPHKTIDDECIHEPKKIRMFRDLDKKDESKSTGILMAKVGDEVVDSRTGKIGIVKGTTGSRSNETTYIVDFDGKEKRINAMRDAQTAGRYYLRKDESLVTEEMDRDSKAFYQKVMELKKYVDTVSRVIKNDQKVDKQSMTVAIQKIGTIYDELVNIRDVSD